jgi:hypothetical protein
MVNIMEIAAVFFWASVNDSAIVPPFAEGSLDERLLGRFTGP